MANCRTDDALHHSPATHALPSYYVPYPRTGTYLLITELNHRTLFPCACECRFKLKQCLGPASTRRYLRFIFRIKYTEGGSRIVSEV